MPISKIKSDGINDAAITTAKLADSSVNSAKIGVDVIAAEDLAANSVTVSEISNGAVTSAKLDTNIAITGDFTVDTSTLHVDSTNNRVGIGIASPSYDLEINDASDPTIRLYDTRGGTQADVRIISHGTTGVGRIGTYSAKHFALMSDSTERMRIESGGKISLSGGSTGSSQTLAVGGGSTSNRATSSQISCIRDSVSTQYEGINFNSGPSRAAYIMRTPNSDDLTFGFDAGSVTDEKMRLDTSGQVLIGATVVNDVNSNNRPPKLYVNTYDESNTDIRLCPSALALRNPRNDGTNGYKIAMKFHFSNGEPGKYAAIAGVADGGYANTTALAFSTNPNGVNGADNNAQRMYIAGNGSIGAPSGTNIYNASDERLKQNITDLTSGLDTISSLRPVSFNWKTGFCKEEDDKTLYGFVAQEVQPVDSNLVEDFAGGSPVWLDIQTENPIEITDPLRVNEKFIIPILVKAMQELKAELDAAKERIAVLENA